MNNPRYEEPLKTLEYLNAKPAERHATAVV